MTINAAWHRQHVMPKNPTEAARLAWHLEHAKHCGCRPIPASLAAKARPIAALKRSLSGGDRRSLRGSKQVLALVLGDPARTSELAALANDDDVLVSMRALDLLEKLAHEHPEWIQPHRALFLGALADSERWELRLQIVRVLPLLRWNAKERRRAIQILLRDVEHRQKFVSAWALDSLASFAEKDAALMPTVRRGLRLFEASGSKALATRARNIRDRLDRA